MLVKVTAIAFDIESLLLTTVDKCSGVVTVDSAIVSFIHHGTATVLITRDRKLTITHDWAV